MSITCTQPLVFVRNFIIQIIQIISVLNSFVFFPMETSSFSKTKLQASTCLWHRKYSVFFFPDLVCLWITTLYKTLHDLVSLKKTFFTTDFLNISWTNGTRKEKRKEIFGNFLAVGGTTNTVQWSNDVVVSLVWSNLWDFQLVRLTIELAFRRNC